MKDFFKTVIGKTTLFILILISVMILALSAVAVVFYVEEDYYSLNESELYGAFETDLAEKNVVETVRNYNNGVKPGSFGNLIYRIRDEEGKTVFCTDGAEEADLKRHINILIDPNMIVNRFYNEIPDNLKGIRYSADYDIKAGYPEDDNFRTLHNLHHTFYSLRYAVYPIDIVCLIVLIMSFVMLMNVAGRKPKTEEIFTGPLYKIPYDLMLLVPFAASIGMIIASNEEEIVAGVVGISALPVFIGLCMSASVRIKKKTFWTNTVIYMALRLLWKAVKWCFRTFAEIVRNIPSLIKAIVLIGVMSIVTLIFAGMTPNDEVLALYAVMIGLIFVPVSLYVALQMLKIKKGAAVLASGNFDQKIDTKYMLFDLKVHAENLNRIADAQKIALEDKLKSERMKTELITNVSHDIKTPLTSIINYADLMSKEEGAGEKTKEYSEVLIRQSVRLKRLLEDLVEASKASTGNLEVDPQPCDAAVFVTQTSGEYEEKLKASELKLITSLPDENIRIMADGRRMQRVFDNLMNNICKYSLPGSRVYIDLHRDGNRALFEFKNTSKEPLNISEEELFERFTRGDSSRNTEGSGLGLSIARDLTELQGGELRLTTDGDLFKAVLGFNVI